MVKILCFGLSTTASHYAAYHILEKLRNRVTERFLKAPLGEVTKHSIGEIKGIMVDKIEDMKPPLAHMILEGCGHIVLPVVSMIALAAIDVRLFLASLITFPLSFVCMGLTFKISGKNFDTYNQSVAQMNSKLEVMGNEVKRIQLTVEELQEYLEMPELPEKENPVKPQNYNIELKDVHFSYGDTEALHGIDLALPQGSFTALVGPSGGGKSTVAKLISRFYDVTKGSIAIGGTDIRDMSLQQLSDTISFVAQDNFLFRCSLKENIRMGNPNATDEEVYAAARAAGSFLFLLLISHYSVKNAPQEKEAARRLQEAVLEYAHGLPTVKSFGKGGASMQAMKDATRENREIRLKIEYGFTPANCGHLLMLKLASVALAGASCYLGYTGEMEFPVMLMFVFFSFSIFASLEPVSDSAHVLAVINEAMAQVEALKEGNFIDKEGREIQIDHYNIQFEHLNFAYEKERQILNGITFQIPEKTTTAIVGPSGSGKSTIHPQ